MNERSLMLVLWAGALIVLVLAVGMTGKSFSGLGELSDRLEGKLEEIEELRTIEEEALRYESARQVFDALPAVQENSLQSLLKTMPGPVKIDDTRVIRRDSVPGWILLQNEIVFAEAPLDEVMNLVCKAELQRPPWRMAKCDIRASAQASGSGQVVLLMEIMVRQSPAP